MLKTVLSWCGKRIVPLMLLAVICLMPAVGYANSAQPPALVIILQNAPDDATVSLVTEEGVVAGSKSRTAWETYYVFYGQNIGTKGEYTLKVSGSGSEYEQKVTSEYLRGYDRVITLDFAAQTIAAGKLLSRSILLVGMRVVFTLAIESLVFFLFGFRQKRSWLVFLAMNILTQGMLNISLNDGVPLANYLMLSLILLECGVFLAETAGALLFIKEHSRLRRVTFVWVANLLSLVLGGLLIIVLPV